MERHRHPNAFDPVSPPDEPDLQPTPDAEAAPPQEIAELAGSLLAYVRRAVACDLDLTAETLPVLDHYLGMVRDQLATRPELLPVIAPPAGAYFGEVVRGVLPSFWCLTGPRPADYYLCLRPVFLAINPVGIAYDVLTHGGDHEGPSPELLLLRDGRATVGRRLGDLPPVPPQEYYLLTTRLEVIEIAAEALRAERLQRQPRLDCYGLRDYERHFSIDGRFVD